MKRTWTLGAVSVALALTTAVVFAQREQGAGVIFARSRSAKFAPLVPGVSSYVAWGDTLTGPFGGFTKFRPGFDAGLHTHTADVLLVVLRGAYLYRDDRSEEHTSELQSPCNLVCRLLLEKKKNTETALL